MKTKPHELYCERMKERRAFLDELTALRKKRFNEVMKKSRDMIGPIWYQVLSPSQRKTLDGLAFAIKQDVLEDRASRSRSAMFELGVRPVPRMRDLMTCILFGRRRAVQFLVEVFKLLYDHSVHVKRDAYPINGRLLLSAICYLEMDDVIQLLMERFYNKPECKTPALKARKKMTSLPLSPYLQRLVAKGPDNRAVPTNMMRRLPPPLPSISDIVNAAYEEESTMVSGRPPAPPPTPPPKKDRIPSRICDQMAGITVINSPQDNSALAMAVKKPEEIKKTKGKGFQIKSKQSCLSLTKNRGYGRGKARPLKPELLRAPRWPNVRFAIGGVAIVNGKPVFINNGITTGDTKHVMINNGIAIIEGVPITMVGGYVVKDPPPKRTSCDCMKWEEKVMKYMEESKCRCGHLYDFYNEGAVKSDEKLFSPPTRHQGYMLDEGKIYELDEKRLFIDSIMRQLVYKDSVIGIKKTASRASQNTTDKPVKPSKSERSGNLKISPSKCMSNNPTPADYLKCTLKSMRRLSVLASLPDVHLVPELVEWMRRRIYGPITPRQRARYLAKSKVYWDFYHRLNIIHWGHPLVPKLPYSNTQLREMNWAHKKMLIKKFAIVMKKYKRSFFLQAANEYNLLWPSMFQDVIPNGSFRKVFFAYFGSRQEEYYLLHPYNATEVMERRLKVESSRMSCMEKFVSQKLD